MKASYLGSLFVLIAATLGEDDNQTQQPIIRDDFVCEDPKYEIHIFSQSPLVIYIKNFITPFEREHLQQVTNGTFARSYVASSDGNDEVSNHRTSSSTTVPSNSVSDSIAHRAQRFQGLDMPITRIEPLQLVRYAQGEEYHFHTDWFSPASTIETGHAGVPRGGNRVSSFFAYVGVSDDLVGGGTNFPKLAAPAGEEWCEYIECDSEWERGVTFRAVEGNAVFWTNLVQGPDGVKKGDGRVLHAGLPVLKGSKLGLNVWSKELDFA